MRKIKIKGTDHGLNRMQAWSHSLSFCGYEADPDHQYRAGDYLLQAGDSTMVVYDGKGWQEIKPEPTLASLEKASGAGIPIPLRMWADASGINLGALLHEDRRIQVQVPNTYFGDGTRKARVNGRRPLSVGDIRGMNTPISYLDELAFWKCDIEDTLLQGKLSALGISESFLSGDSAYSTAAQTYDALLEHVVEATLIQETTLKGASTNATNAVNQSLLKGDEMAARWGDCMALKLATYLQPIVRRSFPAVLLSGI